MLKACTSGDGRRAEGGGGGLLSRRRRRRRPEALGGPLRCGLTASCPARPRPAGTPLRLCLRALPCRTCGRGRWRRAERRHGRRAEGGGGGVLSRRRRSEALGGPLRSCLTASCHARPRPAGTSLRLRLRALPWGTFRRGRWRRAERLHVTCARGRRRHGEMRAERLHVAYRRGR